MRKLLIVAGLTATFVLALVIGSNTVSAAPAVDEPVGMAVQRVEEGDGQLQREGPGPRQPGRVQLSPCARLAKHVLKECPCQGPDGEGWDGKDEYLACVNDVVDPLVAEHEELAECGEKIKARAADSPIGDPDFECPKIRHPRRLPRLRPVLRCARLAHAVIKACPCAGPTGEGWGENGHEKYVQCVKDRLAELVESGAKDRCAALIIKRAENSKIGEDGFECPTPKRLEPPEPRPEP